MFGRLAVFCVFVVGMCVRVVDLRRLTASSTADVADGVVVKVVGVDVFLNGAVVVLALVDDVVVVVAIGS